LVGQVANGRWIVDEGVWQMLCDPFVEEIDAALLIEATTMRVERRVKRTGPQRLPTPLCWTPDAAGRKRVFHGSAVRSSDMNLLPQIRFR